MKLKLLFVADPLETFKSYKDTTLAMMVAAQADGHEIYHADAHTLHSHAEVVFANVKKITVDSESVPFFLVLEQSVSSLEKFSAVLMRQDPPFDTEFLTNTWLLSKAERNGARVFNSPQSLREHSEKISILEFPELIAPTLISRDIKDIRQFHQRYQDIIIKPLDGMGGMGVFRVGADGTNLASIVETLGHQGQRALMAQKYLPEIVDGDKRLLLINGKPIPFVLARVPQAGDIRGNLAAGGLGQARPLTARDQEIGDILGPILIKRGLFLVGLDIIGSYLTEINVTSPTGFVEISQQTQFDVGKHWLMELKTRLTE